MQAETTDETFHDFTTATPWERFVAEIEGVLHSWQKSGEAGDKKAELKHSLPFRKEPYCLHLNWEPGGDESKTDWWRSGRHSIQRWFHVGAYILLVPESFSKRVQDDQEASTLLSALSTALTATSSTWPAFIPLHSAYRQRYLGIRVILDRSNPHTQHFESESTQSAHFPSSLLHATGHLSIFEKALRQYCPEASLAATALTTQMKGNSSLRSTSQHRFSLSIRHTLPLSPIPRDDMGGVMSSDQTSSALPVSEDWDEEAAWRGWISPECPLSGVDVQLIWPRLELDDPDMSLWHLPGLSTAKCVLAAFAKTENKNARAPLIRLSRTNFTPVPGGFNVLLGYLHESASHALSAKDMSDLLEDYWYRSGLSLPRSPPEAAIKAVLLDIFDTDEDGNQRLSQPEDEEIKMGPWMQRTAPPGTLLLLLALHSLEFSNARAVAELWSRFVRELRFRYWDTGRELPRMTSATDAVVKEEKGEGLVGPDLSCCLLHQKLQLLDLCIKTCNGDVGGLDMRRLESVELSCKLSDADEWNTGEWLSVIDSSSEDEFLSCSEDGDVSPSDVDVDIKSEPGSSSGRMGGASTGHGSQAESHGVARLHPTLQLLCTGHPPVCIPELQRLVPLTEDMLMEREDVLQRLEAAEMTQIQMRVQGEQLISDMSAFKAANPGCILDDFVRWYSPVDWVSDNGDPLSGHLSVRMNTEGNAWRQMWDLAKPRPAAQQKRLFNPSKEGERVLHFLETIKPSLLFTELQALGVAAATHVLRQSTGGQFPVIYKEMHSFAGVFGTELQQQGAARDAHTAHYLLGQSILPYFSYLEALAVNAEALERYLGGRGAEPGLVDLVLDIAMAHGAAAWTGLIPASQERHKAHLAKLLGIGPSLSRSNPEGHRYTPKQIEWRLESWDIGDGLSASGEHPQPSPHHMLVTASDNSVHVATAMTARRER